MSNFSSWAGSNDAATTLSFAGSVNISVYDQSEESAEDWCNSTLMIFQAKYRRVYGYLSCAVCLVGIIVNAANIAVLTRKEMLSPVNNLLTVVAASEMIIVSVQLPVSIYFYILRNEQVINSPSPFAEHPEPLWYYIFALSISSLCQTVAAWVTVAVAAFRYISVGHHITGEKLCTLRNANAVSFAIFMAVLLSSIPGWLVVSVVPSTHVTSFPYCLPSADFQGWWTLGYSDLAMERSNIPVASSWLYAVIGKAAPSASLAIFTCLLVKVMRRVELRRTSLASRRGSVVNDAPLTESRRTREQRKSTCVLLAVVVVCLTVEMPQGIMLSLLYADPSFIYFYEFLGDVINTATLIAMSINFFLYTLMMRKFRTAFQKTFCKRVLYQEKKRSSYSNVSNASEPFRL